MFLTIVDWDGRQSDGFWKSEYKSKFTNFTTTYLLGNNVTQPETLWSLKTLPHHKTTAVMRPF